MSTTRKIKGSNRAMKYENYVKKYRRLVNLLVKLGLNYVRKVFWKLTVYQYKKLYRTQFEAMQSAIETLERQPWLLS